LVTVMRAIHDQMAGPEILDRSTSDFPEASGHSQVAGSPVGEGLADAVGVDSKATLERRVEN